VLNFILWRDQNVWLFGAWMGETFSDNTRFLYQYLSENKELYGLKKVVWVTRNNETYKILKSMGYNVAKMHSIKSYFYHLYAGVHLICNMYYKTNRYNGDILGNLSYSATKVQLFHGVGIKACGKMRNTNRETKSTIRAMISNRLNSLAIFSPGGWNKCYFLATSNENKRIAKYDYGYTEDKIIVASYPRLCECTRYLNIEETVIANIIKKKNEGNNIILFLPTFREVSKDFIHPFCIKGFTDFVIQNNIFWLEKKHSADINQSSINISCIHELPSDFDVNVLYPYIDLLITDYSSAASDALFWNKLTLEYCPDFEKYKDDDRGFVAPFSMYHVNDLPVIDAEQLFDAIIDELTNGYGLEKQIKRDTICSLLFDNQQVSYDGIVNKIIAITK
jgi:CDP-glycerol glycerophosphotransferase (TagB/SpsB family)